MLLQIVLKVSYFSLVILLHIRLTLITDAVVITYHVDFITNPVDITNPVIYNYYKSG